MANKGGKITKGGKVSSSQTYQSKNVRTGIESEDRVLRSIPKKFKPERVTKDKTSFDGGIPDIRIYSANNQRLIEVKSVAYTTSEGHGRAQFNRKEIRDLAEQDGLVIIEVRTKSRNIYYQSDAKDIWNKVKDEQGDELKLEYSEIIQLEEYDPNDSSIFTD